MTKTRTVNGIVFLQYKGMTAPITVRATKDKLGQSISLAVDEVGLMIQIPVEPVKDIIEVKGE